MNSSINTKEKVCRIGQISQALAWKFSNSVNSEKLTKEIDRLGICIEDECCHWHELHPAITREDHSGAKEMIFKHGLETNRTPYRTGPGGSCGFWNLDASGCCGFSMK